MRHALLALVLLACAHCAKPAADAYVGAAGAEQGLDLGADAARVPCRQQSGGPASAEIYCNGSDQPAGNVRRGGAAGPSDLAWLATAGDWRLGFDLRFECEKPAPFALANAQGALVLRCRRRAGGWPQVAVIASVDGAAYYAEGTPSLLPVLERSIGD